MNHKKLRRLYREERLQVRRRSGRKRTVGTRAPMALPQGPNQRWSLDFLSDAFADGRRFRILASRCARMSRPPSKRAASRLPKKPNSKPGSRNCSPRWHERNDTDPSHAAAEASGGFRRSRSCCDRDHNFHAVPVPGEAMGRV
jgi:hypothetical protein